MSPPKLPTRQLGLNGPSVTAIGFGTMCLSGFYGPVPPTETRLALLDHAHALGEWHWDTADGYVDSEDLIGEWFRRNPEKRGDIFLATKFGYRSDPESELGFYIDSSPEYAIQACEKSLSRLGISCIDLFYVHRLTPTIPIEKTMRALVQLIHAGKIKHIGLSEVSASTLRRAHAIHPIAAVQAEYSPYALDIERNGVLSTCKELGIALVAYSPLGRGFFGGSLTSTSTLAADDFRRTVPKYDGAALENNQRVLRAFEAVAERKGVAVGQVTLAWLLGRGGMVFVIPGTKRRVFLEENCRAGEVELGEEEERELREAVEGGESGGRYESRLEGLLFVDTVELGEEEEEEEK